jgi:CheY-like chemotaxis protein
MALLLDDLLEVSRITQGQLVLKKQRVAVPSLITAAVETVRPLIDSKELTLTVHPPSYGFDLDADPLRLSQALSNLLTNAAKFTPPGGHVDFTVSKTPTDIIIAVRDTGIGFEPALAHKLFEMFTQAHDAIEAAEGGLGIGLCLVKGLIEMHGGSVSAESGGRGLGAEFKITLPRSMILEAAAPAATSSELDPLLPSDPSLPERRARVLVADDNRDAADSLGVLLKLADYEVNVAYSGTAALACGERYGPDIVILDIGMPDMDGYEVARCARQKPWGQSAYLIALTGWGQAADKERTAAAGFDNHLTKPIDADLLRSLLEATLRDRRALDAAPTGVG